MLIDLTLSLPADHAAFARNREAWAMPMSSGHVGTHLDTLLHRPIPLDWMDRSARLVDARSFGADIGLDVLAGVPVAAGDFVLFRTDHIRRHAYGETEYFRDHPQLDWPLVNHLIGKKVSFIGIDAAGLRRGREEHARVDRFCEENGAYVIENLTNLDALAARTDGPFAARLAWIAHGGLTGIPVKVVAEVPDGD